MLYTIAAILLIVWLVGLLGVFSIGWFIHIFLVVAIILLIIRIL